MLLQLKDNAVVKLDRSDNLFGLRGKEIINEVVTTQQIYIYRLRGCVLINFAFPIDVRAHRELIIKSVLWWYVLVMEFRWDMMKDASAFEWYELWIDNTGAICGMERWMRRDFRSQRKGFRFEMIISKEPFKKDIFMRIW